MFPIPLESEERKEMESDGDGFCGSERGGAGTSAAFGSAQDHEKIRTREAIENVSFHGPARLSGPCINGGGMFSGCRATRPPARPRLCVTRFPLFHLPPYSPFIFPFLSMPHPSFTLRRLKAPQHRVCVRARARACVHTCMRACVHSIACACVVACVCVCPCVRATPCVCVSLQIRVRACVRVSAFACSRLRVRVFV